MDVKKALERKLQYFLQSMIGLEDWEKDTVSN